jgi:hypothetical protein
MEQQEQPRWRITRRQEAGSVDPWYRRCLNRRCPYRLPLRQDALGLAQAFSSSGSDRRRWDLVPSRRMEMLGSQQESVSDELE